MKIRKKRKKKLPLWAVCFLDILLTGAILVIFAFFHHVYPRLVAQQELEQLLQSTEPVQTQAAPTEATVTEPVVETEAPVEETTQPTEPDSRTEWQKKFADKFTDEVVMTENSYSSPEVSITIEKISTMVDGAPVIYYLADVYIASMDNFATYTAYNQIVYYGAQDPVGMTKDTNAIFAVNGDYLTVQKSGFLVRNSNVFVSDRNNSICVLYPDGTMEGYDQGTYEVEDILARDPVQVWSFGPNLLDENGKAKEEYVASSGVAGVHPRCAVGYYEPGHYCFIVAEGRKNNSVGLRLTQLAQIFEELGCQVAYNMDGGASAVMVYDHKRVNTPSNGGRDVGDILYIRDSYFGKNAEAQEVE